VKLVKKDIIKLTF